MTQDFTGFGLPAKLMQALERMKFTTPTPVQKEAIPVALSGADILASAQTGTGKTGAFGIPLISKLMEDATAQALIMAPTRELAAQILAAIQQMINVPNIKTALLIGGESMPRQFRQLDQHPRLIIGTPGRITDHLMRGSLKLAHARFLVLDETDRMLDMGFGPQIDKIMEYMPKERQTMMFSATLPHNIVNMSRKYMKDAKRITVGSTNTAHVKIKQELIKMGEGEKYQHLLAQLKEREGSIIIFVKTKYGTEKLSDKLNKDEHKSDAIHGDLQQRRRDRVIQGFRDKRYRILVATDVAARGLDIPHIEHVINYDMPQAPEDYIHRIGRTARAGAEGCAVNFLTPSDNAKWNAIYRLMNPGASAPANSGGGGRGGQDRGRRGPPKRWGAPGERRDGGGYKGGGYKGGGERRSFGAGHAASAEGAGGERRPHTAAGDYRSHKPAGERSADGERRSHAAVGEHRPHRDAKSGGGYKGSGERRSFGAGHAAAAEGAGGERRSHAATGEHRSHKPAGERHASSERRPHTGEHRGRSGGHGGGQSGGYKGHRGQASRGKAG